jgi:hypothetical protein
MLSANCLGEFSAVYRLFLRTVRCSCFSGKFLRRSYPLLRILNRFQRTYEKRLLRRSESRVGQDHLSPRGVLPIDADI